MDAAHFIPSPRHVAVSKRSSRLPRRAPPGSAALLLHLLLLLLHLLLLVLLSL